MTEQAKLSDYRALLDFENRVFHVRFLGKVPKLYRDPAFCVSCHGVIKENDRIVAAIAAYPTELQTSAGTLKGLGIGSVAVDPACRGKGYMKDMMRHCDDIANETGAAFAFLSGYRQRYEYYGYTPCGVRYRYEICDYTIGRAKDKGAYSFSTLRRDPDAVTELSRLFSGEDYHWRREEADFPVIAASFYCKCYTIRDAEKRLVGYLMTERFFGEIDELVLLPDIRALDVLAAFAKHKKWKSLRVTLDAHQLSLRRQLDKIGERPAILPPAQFKIYRFRPVIETLGTYHAQHMPLVEGSLVMKIDDETLRVTVKDGVCTAVPTDDTPELTFTAIEAAAALTTHQGALCGHPLLTAWTPLCTLSIRHCDEV